MVGNMKQRLFLILFMAMAAIAVAGPAGFETLMPVVGDTALDTAQKELYATVAGANSATIIHADTNGTDGTLWVAFPSAACNQVKVFNVSGTTLNVRRGGAGDFMPIPTGATYTFVAVTNANQLSIRRADTASTTVTLNAEALN